MAATAGIQVGMESTSSTGSLSLGAGYLSQTMGSLAVGAKSPRMAAVAGASTSNPTGYLPYVLGYTLLISLALAVCIHLANKKFTFLKFGKESPANEQTPVQ